MKSETKAIILALIVATVAVLAVLPSEDASAAATFTVNSVDDDKGETNVTVVLDSAYTNITLNMGDFNGDGVSETASTTFNIVLSGALVSGTEYKYSIVDNEASVTGTQIDSGSYTYTAKSDEPTTYKIEVQEAEHGTVTADNAIAAENETVTLTVTPADGYEVSAVTYNGTAIAAVDGKYTFTMPASDVVVVATFKVQTTTEDTGITVDGNNYSTTSDAIKAASEGTTSAEKTVKISGQKTETDTVELVKNVTIEVQADSTYEAAVSYDGSVAKIRIATGSSAVRITGGSVEISGPITSDSEIEVTEGTTVLSGSVSSSLGITVANDATLQFGTFDILSGASVDITSSGTIAGGENVTVHSGAYVWSNASIGSYKVDDSGISTAYLGGAIADMYYGPNQRVEVDKDATVSGTLSVEGELHVQAGVTLTILSTGSLYIDNAFTSTVEGTLVIQGADSDGNTARLEISGLATLDVAGTLTVNGNVYNNGQNPVVIEQGANASIGTEGSIHGTYEIADSASLTVSGIINYASFDVAGTLTIDSSVVSEGFSVELSDGAVLEIERVVLSNGSSIAVSDPGVQLYDSKNRTEVVGVLSGFGNTVQIDAASTETDASTNPADEGTYTYGTAITGITVTTAMKETKIVTDGTSTTNTKVAGTSTTYKSLESTEKQYNGCHQHAYTMSISGTIGAAGAVVYSGTLNAPTVTGTVEITATANPYMTIPSATVIGTGVAFIASDGQAKSTFTVSGPVVLNYAAPTSGDATAVNMGTFTNMTALTVEAAIDATAYAGLFTNTGSIEVSSGDLSVLTSEINVGNGISAAAYHLGSRTTTSPYIYHYVAVGDAIAKMNDGTTKAVTVYGTQTLSESAEIPAGATLTLNGATLTVGKRNTTDVVLTIASGAALTGTNEPKVAVNGTVYALDSSNVKIKSAISAQVVSYEQDSNGKQVSTGWQRWTNLTVALSEASEGSAVKLQQDATLSADTLIPAKVTVIANGNTVLVKQKATLTIEGTLDLVTVDTDVTTDSALQIEGATLNAAGNATTARGAVVLSGYITYSDLGQITRGADTTSGSGAQSTYTVPGAYYQATVDKTDVNYISTYANGAAAIATAVDQTVELKADADSSNALVLGTVSFTGAPNDDVDHATVVISDAAKVTGTITLKDAVLTITGITAGTTVAADISGNNGSISVNALIENGKSLQASAVTLGEDDDAVTGLFVAGSLSDIPVNGSAVSTDRNSSVEVSDTVYVVGALAVGTDSLSVPGNLIVAEAPGASSAGSLEADALSVSGTLLVDDGATVSATSMTVSGEATVSEGAVTVDGTLTVSGKLDAAAVNSSGIYTGKVTASTIYIGVTSAIISTSDSRVSSMKTTATASVTGWVVLADGDLNFAVAAYGATVPAAWTAADSALGSGAASNLILAKTLYTVAATTGADEYVTAYAHSLNGVPVNKIRAHVDDTEFGGWYSAADSRKAQLADTVYVGSVENAVAILKTEIFEVTINTDGGIGRVTLNGVLMEQHGSVFSTASDIKAGTYTVGFAAASGYDASKVQLTDASGVALTSFDIVVSASTTVGGSVTYQLVGTSAASSSSGISSDDIKSITDAIKDNTEEIKNKQTSVTVNGSSDDGDNGLTNILLVVLVILILVMAILVAMRMMRS